ncbi:MAG: mevalonate kinase [Anaerolineae bacterium]|jgi:mevalonate kinase|nr:mevalonate kinase [Anaerolineae bacterium]MBT7190833.1 mevalonate kinase [Anaerolineae bacterium]MBT7991596.1 mevalonate kinase [Anaerolineae bacterium]
MTKATAPGKIILFGEHAVVYGQPALAVPVNQIHADAEVLDVDRAGGIWVNAPDIGLHEELSRIAPDDALATVIRSVFSALGISVIARRTLSDEAISLTVMEIASSQTHAPRKDMREGIEIKITSTIPLASGLGSGAAVSVAIIRALSAHLGHPLRDERVNEIAYEVEKIHHGTPSGIDNTVVTYGKPIFFLKIPYWVFPPISGSKFPPPKGEKSPRWGRKDRNAIELLNVAKPFTIIIGDTGIPAPTKESVADVRKLWEQNPHEIETLFAAAGSIAKTARQSIEGGHPERLGALMNENQRILQEMGVSSPELDRLTEASLKSGASGAKLSGGGRGGNMIALSTKENAPTIVEALYKAGAKNVIVTNIE